MPFPPVQVPIPATHAPAMIAILEDDEPTCELYHLLLENQGYRLGVFDDHDQCCAFIRATHPDLLIFDVIGSTQNGLSVLDALYAEFGEQLPPVIVATALQQYQIANHPVLQHLPNLRTLFKPFDISEMLQAVKDLC